MKIILKNGATYNISRTNTNILSELKKINEVKNAPENYTSAYVTDLILKTEPNEVSDLFQIEKDFSLENITDVTFMTESGAEMKDSYDGISKIFQTITDYVNETSVSLIKYK